MRLLATAAIVAALAVPAGTAAAQEAETVTRDGVTLPTQVTAQGTPLVLNGVGLRKKAIFKVYVAGLYLPAKTTDADTIFSGDQPRRIVLQFLRGVGQDQMCDAMNDGLKNNTPDASAELKAKFEQFCGMMVDVDKGEQFVFTYIPGTGTIIEAKGERRGIVGGKDFADALFRSFIGPKPGPGQGFKKDLLKG